MDRENRKTQLAWEWRDSTGLEYLVLEETNHGVLARGWVVGDLEGQMIRLRYTVRCDPRWNFQQADVDLELPASPPEKLAIRTQEDGGWYVNGVARPDLAGCTQIDIRATPFTNTLPIRGLDLQPEVETPLQVAYIPIPRLEALAVRQSYTRLDSADPPARFRYRSLDSGLTADLLVDGQGLVVDYPGIWRRV